MRNQEIYLKQTVILEPLAYNWYAWSFLISPITAAAFIKNSFMKLLNSFADEPEFHTMMASDPALLGGPICDLPIEAVANVKNLLRNIELNCTTLLKLNAAVINFNNYLLQVAKGYSLEGLYADLPEELRGCVELVYDINCQPGIRFFEPIIYDKYYNTDFQSIALKNLTTDRREFILSSPRFENENEIHLPIAFHDKRIDAIFNAQTTPIKFDDLINLLEVPEKKIPKLQQLIEPATNRVAQECQQDKNYQGEGIRVRYINHACVLLQTRGMNILLDPIISHHQVSDLDRYTLSDMPDVIDYALITHNHQDHLVIETLLALRQKIKRVVVSTHASGSIVDPSLKLVLEAIGMNEVIVLDKFEKINLPDGQIISIPSLGEHGDLNIQSKTAYVIQLLGKKFLFAADSNNLDQVLYDNIFSHVGKVDTLFIGMECKGAPVSWVYEPLFNKPLPREFNQSRRLSGSDYARAWPIVERSGAKEVYVYAMGMEPWLTHIMALNYNDSSPQIIESNKLVQKCFSEGIRSERLFGKKEWIYH